MVDLKTFLGLAMPNQSGLGVMAEHLTQLCIVSVYNTLKGITSKEFACKYYL